jgi:hypothetical protein
MDEPTGNMFYVIQLMPAEAPWHIKLGFSSNLENRLASYRMLCPQAHLVKVYSCPDIGAERHTLRFVEKMGFECIGGEVFRCPVLSDLLQCLDRYFSSHLQDPAYVPPPRDSGWPAGAIRKHKQHQ